MNQTISWEHLDTPWKRCFVEAWDAFCQGSLPIGAAIISSTGAIIATGHNQVSPSDTDDDPSGTAVRNYRLAHAEINALLALPDGSIQHPVRFTARLNPAHCV